MITIFLMGLLFGIIIAIIWWVYQQKENNIYKEDIKCLHYCMRNKIIEETRKSRNTISDNIEGVSKIEGMCEMLSIYEDYFDDVIHKELEDK